MTPHEIVSAIPVARMMQEFERTMLLHKIEDEIQKRDRAIRYMLCLFDDEGNFREEFQDQASMALEMATKALCEERRQ